METRNNATELKELLDAQALVQQNMADYAHAGAHDKVAQTEFQHSLDDFHRMVRRSVNNEGGLPLDQVAKIAGDLKHSLGMTSESLSTAAERDEQSFGKGSSARNLRELSMDSLKAAGGVRQTEDYVNVAAKKEAEKTNGVSPTQISSNNNSGRSIG